MSSRYAWTGVVLAGGRSTRMGRDKALLEVEGKPLLVRALDRLRPHVRELLVIGDPRKYGRYHSPVVPDDVEGAGPLGGILTAMGRATQDRLLVMACDLPGVTDGLLRDLTRGIQESDDAFIPRHAGQLEPLIAAYHRRCAPVFLERLKRGELSMHGALAEVHAAYLDVVDPPEDLFRNLNAPDDL